MLTITLWCSIPVLIISILGGILFLCCRKYHISLSEQCQHVYQEKMDEKTGEGVLVSNPDVYMDDMDECWSLSGSGSGNYHFI